MKLSQKVQAAGSKQLCRISDSRILVVFLTMLINQSSFPRFPGITTEKVSEYVFGEPMKSVYISQPEPSYP